jgi:hypothetical protein
METDYQLLWILEEPTPIPCQKDILQSWRKLKQIKGNHSLLSIELKLRGEGSQKVQSQQLASSTNATIV